MRRLVVIVATGLLVSGCMLRISTDPFTNTTSQHRTQVEPDTFSFGSTVVATFQSGRFFDGGASDIGWATSTDGGSHWTTGFLDGITKYRGAGPYDRASDPSVAYDARHGVWLIAALTVVTVARHPVAGNLRSDPLPTAEIDAAGRVYVAWADCRYRSGCAANDIVMSTSLNGTSWSPVTRVPIDATTSTVDHFIPGLGVDKATSGSSAHLALAYYYYPNASCTSSNCQLAVGFVSSTNGGTTWSSAQQLAGPMSLSSLASTNQGPMVGDYVSTSFSGGKAFPVVAVANPPSNSTLDEAMYTVAGGVAVAGCTASGVGDQAVAAPVPNA